MTRRPLSPALAAVREALLDAWAVVQPIECLGCGLPDRSCCAACREELASPRVARVRCDADPGVPVLAAADYAGAAKHALLALKDDGRTDAAVPLAAMLIAAIREVPRLAAAPRSSTGAGDGRRGRTFTAERPSLGAHLLPQCSPRDAMRLEVAWVPSRRAALRRRGYDPVEEILRAARVPASRVLVAVRGRSQKTRGRAERLATAGDPARFRVRGSSGLLSGRSFLLVDDVATTGATLATAAAAIRAAGGVVVAAVAVCAPGLERRAVRGRGARRGSGLPVPVPSDAQEPPRRHR